MWTHSFVFLRVSMLLSHTSLPSQRALFTTFGAHCVSSSNDTDMLYTCLLKTYLSCKGYKYMLRTCPLITYFPDAHLLITQVENVYFSFHLDTHVGNVYSMCLFGPSFPDYDILDHFCWKYGALGIILIFKLFCHWIKSLLFDGDSEKQHYEEQYIT